MKLSIIAISLAQAACISAAPRKCRGPKSEVAAAASAAPSADAPYPSASAVPAQSSVAPIQPSSALPAPSAVVSVPAKASEAAKPSEAANPSSAPAAAPSAPASNSPASGGKPMIDSINEYRKRANLPLFKWDSKLAANAQKTCTDAGGNTLAHELNEGSFGQTMVYGFNDADKCTKDTKSWTPFEIFFYSWMCERETDPALGGICQQIWDIGHIADGGQTGHHDILASADYKTIGCAFGRDPKKPACDAFPGIWTCDVGY